MICSQVVKAGFSSVEHLTVRRMLITERRNTKGRTSVCSTNVFTTDCMEGHPSSDSCMSSCSFKRCCSAEAQHDTLDASLPSVAPCSSTDDAMQDLEITFHYISSTRFRSKEDKTGAGVRW